MCVSSDVKRAVSNPSTVHVGRWDTPIRRVLHTGFNVRGRAACAPGPPPRRAGGAGSPDTGERGSTMTTRHPDGGAAVDRAAMRGRLIDTRYCQRHYLRTDPLHMHTSGLLARS